MPKEKAEKVVELISKIGEAQASIRVNIFCDNATSAAHNTKILGKLESQLIELLTEKE